MGSTELSQPDLHTFTTRGQAAEQEEMTKETHAEKRERLPPGEHNPAPPPRHMWSPRRTCDGLVVHLQRLGAADGEADAAGQVLGRERAELVHGIDVLRGERLGVAVRHLRGDALVRVGRAHERVQVRARRPGERTRRHSAQLGAEQRERHGAGLKEARRGL